MLKLNIFQNIELQTIHLQITFDENSHKDENEEDELDVDDENLVKAAQWLFQRPI